jgi:Pyruvate/2-oxoacid:ferredoxin oxidoreductase gamma subunit
MLPVFPLGVKKDSSAEPWTWPQRSFEPAPLLEALGVEREPPGRDPARPARAEQRPEVGLKLAGAGGDGAQTAAMLVAIAAVEEGLDATYIPSYGPESRGGTSYADVRVANDEVLSPDVPAPDALVAFKAPSLAKFAPTVAPGGVIVFDSSVMQEPSGLPPRVRAIPVPCSRVASELGHARVKNIVALGALYAATGLLPEETLLQTIRDALAGKGALAAVNEEAFRRGVRWVREQAPTS